MANNTPRSMMRLKTARAGDDLWPIQFSAEEALSTPYRITVEAISPVRNIDPNTLLFTDATLSVQRNDGQTRLFGGRIRGFTSSAMQSREFWHYALTIVPPMWFLEQTQDCRIFQNISIPDIIAKVCREQGVAMNMKATGAAWKYRYITQYNETSLQFLSRLMERVGLAYYFDHSTMPPVFTVVEANSQFPTSPKPKLTVERSASNAAALHNWRQMPATTWGSVEVAGFSAFAFKAQVRGKQATVLAAPGADKRRAVLFQEKVNKPPIAEEFAKLVIEAAEAEAALIACDGFDPTLTAGSRFVLTKNLITGGIDEEYIVRRIYHTGSDTSMLDGGTAATYTNSILALPVKTPFRPPMATPRPVMPGLCSGVVIGSGGEDIDCGTGEVTYGWIKVRMVFDHGKTTSPESTPWVRVLQGWAGNSWGHQHLPRVGTEVAIAFLDGDPDRPVAIGGLYNSENAPIFPLPAEKNKSGWRTRSTKSGETANFSEFSVDDSKGKEKVLFHAERDYTQEVEHDETLSVGNDQTETITGNRSAEIKEGDDTLKVTKGNRTVTLNKGNDTLAVKTGNLAIDVSLGNITIEAGVGKISVKAMQGIELEVCGNTIKIDPAGVTINGMLVKVEAKAMAEVKGAMTQVSGDGMLMAKGGITMIN